MLTMYGENYPHRKKISENYYEIPTWHFDSAGDFIEKTVSYMTDDCMRITKDMSFIWTWDGQTYWPKSGKRRWTNQGCYRLSERQFFNPSWGTVLKKYWNAQSIRFERI